MSRIPLASLATGVIVSQDNQLVVGARIAVTIHGTSTPVPVYADETSMIKIALPTTDSVGRLPGWVDTGQTVDIAATYNGTTFPVAVTPVAPGDALAASDNLAGLTDKALARFNLGIDSAPVLPVNTGAPVISAAPIPIQGQTLTATAGTWDNSPVSYGFQWRRGGVDITGARASTYTLTAADVGFTLDVVVTATNGAGSVNAASNVTATVIAAAPAIPQATFIPAITGTASQGQVLAADHGTWTNAPTSYAYQWARDGVNLVATGATYTVAGGDVGHALTVTVTATNAAGFGVATSLPTAMVIAAPFNTVGPTITGTPALGQTLTLHNGTWSNTPTSYTYVWKRDGVAIGGATASTYVLVVADIGTSISATVTATNAAGSTSAPAGGTATVVTVVPANSVAPAITGSTVQGHILSVTNGTWTGGPVDSYTYVWKRAGTPITGATASTYTTVSADVGNAITCTVTATNGAGSASATSSATASITAPAPPSPMTHSGTNPVTGTAYVTPASYATLAKSWPFLSSMPPNWVAEPNSNRGYSAVQYVAGQVAFTGSAVELIAATGGVKPYKSGWITTQPGLAGNPGYTWKYGRLLVTAQMPALNDGTWADGMWPAIWMDNAGNTLELDLSEMLTDDATTKFTLHDWGRGISSSTYDGTVSPDAVADFHTFEMIWEPGMITIGIDGAAVAQITKTYYEAHFGTWGFDNLADAFAPFLIINNAVNNGEWTGGPPLIANSDGNQADTRTALGGGAGSTDGGIPMLISLVEVYQTAPVNTAAPTITGTPTQGQVLTANPGTWSNFPSGYTYVWKRGGTPITGATGSTYTLVTADGGQTITVTVTAINDAGNASATSAPTAPIASSGGALAFDGTSDGTQFGWIQDTQSGAVVPSQRGTLANPTWSVIESGTHNPVNSGSGADPRLLVVSSLGGRAFPYRMSAYEGDYGGQTPLNLYPAGGSPHPTVALQAPFMVNTAAHKTAGQYSDVYIASSIWLPGTNGRGDNPWVPISGAGRTLVVTDVYGPPYAGTAATTLSLRSSGGNNIFGMWMGGTPFSQWWVSPAAVTEAWHDFIWHIKFDETAGYPNNGYMELWHSLNAGATFGGAGWTQATFTAGGSATTANGGKALVVKTADTAINYTPGAQGNYIIWNNYRSFFGSSINPVTLYHWAPRVGLSFADLTAFGSPAPVTPPVIT